MEKENIKGVVAASAGNHAQGVASYGANVVLNKKLMILMQL